MSVSRRTEGKGAIDVRGTLHVTRDPGRALCGAETVAYALHSDTRTFFHCGGCIDRIIVTLAPRVAA